MSHKPVKIEEVKEFWNKNPLCSQIIPYPVGTKEYLEYYDKLREENESVEFSYKLHEYKDFANKKVLDVGCGNGYVLSRYAKEGAETYGIDITETGIQICKNRFEFMNLKGNFVVGNAEELPFEDNFFDCVCSMGVLHHVPNTEKAVSEIHRVLKKDGRLIVMFYHRDSAFCNLYFSTVRMITGKTLEQCIDDYDGIGNPKGDVYSKKELGVLLNNFSDLDMFISYLVGEMTLPKIGKFIPKSLLKKYEDKYGWFLYAKGYKR